MRKHFYGFTLIELMITVAIVAILAAIALPAYEDYIRKTRASEFMSVLSGYKAALSECYNISQTVNPCQAGTNGIPANITTPFGHVAKVITLTAYNGDVLSPGADPLTASYIGTVLQPTAENGFTAADSIGIIGRSTSVQGKLEWCVAGTLANAGYVQDPNRAMCEEPEVVAVGTVAALVLLLT